ncbi:MAG: tetratricopeptide repeat protein [Vicinamibacterales bacterium]|jgi:lipoprotein NlpI|nr:tetratricopeptide repeat protein [Vicinamibacterales bacterium]MDP6608448.1 tetratricopeptide repeat protein [Vicinamibacterales bacterium]|tara:strand:- start:21812 stop:22405 length:594 start_codon:yes stop_codon:yes gene_type:complete
MRWGLAGVLALPVMVGAQEPPNLRQLFETGQYQAVVDNLPQRADDPAAIYLAVQSYARLQQPARVTVLLDQLAARPVEDPWHHVGRAVLLVSRGDFEGALASANQAVAVGAAVPEAHYQLGLVLAGRREFPAAAAAFDAAAERDPSYAYAFYQAGLAYYRHRRIDVMAARFEAFLKTAPQAPERTQVESIMRTVRGR